MIRHIFMATAKEGIPDEVINRKTDEMRAMKDSVPAIRAITVTGNLGWAGPANVVTMTVGVKDRTESNVLLADPAHCEVTDKIVEVLRTDNLVMARVEL